jgi:hypothetical protein
MGTYFKGNLVRCFCYFEENGERVVPDTVTFKIKNPNGNVSTYVYGTDDELEKDAENLFSIDIEASVPGQWFYRFESTGTGQAAFESEFIVRKGQF